MPGSSEDSGYYAFGDSPWGQWIEDPITVAERWLEAVRLNHFRTNEPTVPIQVSRDGNYFMATSQFGDQLAIILRPESAPAYRRGLTLDQAEYIQFLIDQFNFAHCSRVLEPKPKAVKKAA